MASADTSPEAHRQQMAALDAMTDGERLAAVLAMGDDVRTLALAGIRMRNPTFGEADVHRAWLAQLHGEELADRLVTMMPDYR